MSHKNIAWVICWLLSVGLIVRRQQSVFPAGFTLNSLSYQVPNIPACCLLILESRAWNMGIRGPEGKVELGHLYGCDSISLGTISRGPDWEGKSEHSYHKTKSFQFCFSASEPYLAELSQTLQASCFPSFSVLFFFLSGSLIPTKATSELKPS